MVKKTHPKKHSVLFFFIHIWGSVFTERINYFNYLDIYYAKIIENNLFTD